MSHNQELIEVQTLHILQQSISEITGIPFSIYNSKGVTLIPFKKEDKVLDYSKNLLNREEDILIKGIIDRSFLRKEPLIVKTDENHHQFFIPISVNNSKLILISDPLYQDYTSIQKIVSNIKTIFDTFLKNNYEKNLNRRKYQWAKSFIEVISDIKTDISIKEVYSLILDTVLFLFNIDSASIFINDKNVFKSLMATGILKDTIRKISIPSDNPLIDSSLKSSNPFFIDNPLDIGRLGFSEDIKSVHIVPILCTDYIQGFIGIFNSPLSTDAAYSISDFCKLSCLILRNLQAKDAYNNCINDMKALHLTLSKLMPKIHDPNVIYDAIVESVAELLKAEKCSLMLVEGDSLMIKAIKGINKWLVQDIRIQIGEGISGRVFKNGSPFFVKDIESITIADIKPRRHYKTGSFISVPLKFNSDITGVLNVADKQTGEGFTERDLNLLNYFASFISIAIKMHNYHVNVERLIEFSITDHLTGLFNRRYLYERFAEEIHRSERHNMVFSFAIFDIDDFKLFNDTEGHLAGDIVLKEVAQISRNSLRADDVICRFGGEEFAILMPQTNKEEAFVVAERIRNNIKNLVTYKWERFPYKHLTISMGISSYPVDGNNIEEIIKNADEALYKAKAEGKDRTIIFNKTINLID